MLLVRKRIHSVDSFLYTSGAFEIKLLGSNQHVLSHVAHELVMMTVEETCNSFYILCVLFGRYGAATYAWPKTDMCIKAWS